MNDAPELVGHPQREALIAAETADRLINRAYRAARDGDGLTVDRAMTALADTATTLDPETSSPIFSPLHRKACAVISAYLRVADTATGRYMTDQLADLDGDWVEAVIAYADRAMALSATHIRTQALSDAIAAQARDNVRTALHLTEETR